MVCLESSTGVLATTSWPVVDTVGVVVVLIDADVVAGVVEAATNGAVVVVASVGSDAVGLEVTSLTSNPSI